MIIRLVKALFVLFTLGAVASALAGLYAHNLYSGPGPLAQERFTVIDKGNGVAAIAAQLEEERVISNALLFRIAARLGGQDGALKAGEYRFDPAVPMKEVLAMLAAGDVFQRRFTVPEGLTSWQIVQILNGVEALAGDIEEIPPEGTLLPETYSFVKGESRVAKITQMQQAMTQTLAALWEERAEDLPLASPEEALILASIVEKETGAADEMDKVAGVFINRVRIGMRLQSDPTVIYALTGGQVQQDGQGPIGRRLLRSDWEYDSPYNTYKYAGLPPGPIANPGRAALAAVLNPQDHDYLYFVADGSGGHAFATTLAGHNRNVARWRAIRDGRGNTE